MKPDDFIAALAPAARASMALTKIPASFTIAQGALESTWGSSELATRAMNLFSVKADRGWAGPVVLMNSFEVVNGKRVMLPASWRKYPSWQACLDDRARFFRENPRYAHCFSQTTGEDWARAVTAAGYATDPAYADKIIAVMHSHCLSRFDVHQE